MRIFLCWLNKDRIEIIRGRKNITCFCVLLACACLVMVTTSMLPLLLDKAMNITNFLSGDTTLADFMSQFFPADLKGSMGIFSSDVGIFYSLVLIIFTFNLLPSEIASGKMILPLCAGHNKNMLLLSKQLTYSTLLAFPVFPVYLLYYTIGTSLLQNNYDFKTAVGNALVLTSVAFFVTSITIVLSVVMKRKYLTLATMVVAIMVAPDLLSYFTFGQYFPTYLLTFSYNTSSTFSSLIVPYAVTIVLLLFLDIWAIKKRFTVDVDARY